MTGAPIVSDLMELMDASIRQGKAVATGDEIGAGIAYREALAVLGRLLRRLDPDGADAAATLMTRAGRQEAG